MPTSVASWLPCGHPPVLGMDRVAVRGPVGHARAVVLVLHGGSEVSRAPARRGVAWLRMTPIARAVHRATRDAGVAVWQLRNRYRGWNEPDLDPVQDARWALARIEERHPGAPIVLVGHSMGGRVALRVADAPGVVAVCALAPWVEPGEPTEQLAGRTVLVVHGNRDRETDPAASKEYAERVGAEVRTLPGEGHTMLRRPRVWNAVVTAFVRTTLDLTDH